MAEVATPETPAPESADLDEIELPEEPEEPEDDLPGDEVEDAAEAQGAAAEETPAAPPAPMHPPELIERATTLMIPADQVAAMSSDTLRVMIANMDRIGKTVYDSMSKQAPAAPKPEPVADDLAVFDDPEKYDQEFVKPIKSVLARQAEENRVLRERLEKLEKTHAVTSQQTLHSRLMSVAAEVAPEAAKVFDISTPTGQAKYNELLDQMGAVQRHNKTLTEKQIFQRALKALDVIPEKPKDPPEVADKKRAWDAAALAKPTTRKTKDTAEDRVGRLLASIRNQKPVNGAGR